MRGVCALMVFSVMLQERFSFLGFRTTVTALYCHSVILPYNLFSHFFDGNCTSLSWRYMTHGEGDEFMYRKVFQRIELSIE